MKFTDVTSPPGEFASKALFRIHDGLGWVLSQAYFFSFDEARKAHGTGFDVKWPVEVFDDGLIYIPDPSEMC